MSQNTTSKKLNKIYYSEKGYFIGGNAARKLSELSGVGERETERWLREQPVYQVYLPRPRYVPRPNASSSDVLEVGEIHQADLLFLPTDVFEGARYKYALCVVDVASRYKAARQLTSKRSKEVASAFEWIYNNTALKAPKLLIVDDGKEFYGDVTKMFSKVQRGDPSQHRSQGIVERFNETLSRRLFRHQYNEEIKRPTARNTEWVGRLQGVVDAINSEVTRLIGMAPKDAVRLKSVKQGKSLPVRGDRVDDLDVGDRVRYLYEDGELEGVVFKGERRRRATDPNWSLHVYEIDKWFVDQGLRLYYLKKRDDFFTPDRYFVREELMLV